MTGGLTSATEGAGDGAASAGGETGTRSDTVRLHRRSIEIEVFDAGETALGVRSRLLDQRPWHPNPQRLVLHDMVLELEVSLTDMTITRAGAEMVAFPHAECPLIAPRFAGLVGISVARGFTRALREVFGGVSGCSHLHELARATGPAVIQARMSHRARRRDTADEQAAVGTPAAAATGGAPMRTCHIWAEDGIAVRKLAAGWRPGPATEYPAPTLERILAAHGDD
jgi:hypothetical protein